MMTNDRPLPPPPDGPVVIPGDSLWGELAGAQKEGCVIIVCVVCHMALPIARLVGQVLGADVEQAAERAGWAVEDGEWMCEGCQEGVFHS